MIHTTDQRIRLKDFNAGTHWRSISVQRATCDCDTFSLANGCDHLTALGIHRCKPFTPRTHPTFSQALSALVKSIRLRRIEDAVYWLVYLDTFKERPHRFRTARRLLIGAAEDGHSIAVMENVRERFSAMTKPESALTTWVAEALRICALPNWWHADSGGPDYIYCSLVGERAWRYRSWDRSVPTVVAEITRAVAEGDKPHALGALMAFNMVRETFGSTKQAEFVLGLAEAAGHDRATRLCRIHLSARSALSGDNNFIAQAVWTLAGGVSPIAERDVSVSQEQCAQLLEQAQDRWKYPEPIPRWCLDGVHSAGDDPRFMGMLPEMWAVCRAFQHYGRVDPDDEWLPEFRCWDGLIIDSASDAARRA